MIPLSDPGTILLAENMTMLYGCNKKITAMNPGLENEPSSRGSCTNRVRVFLPALVSSFMELVMSSVVDGNEQVPAENLWKKSRKPNSA